MSIILFEHIDGDTVGPIHEPLALSLEADYEGFAQLIDGHLAEVLTDGRGVVLHMIVVKPEHRGKHFGSDLLEAVTEWADDRGLGLFLAAVPEADCPIDVLSWYGRWGWSQNPWSDSEGIMWRPPTTSIERPASGAVAR